MLVVTPPPAVDPALWQRLQDEIDAAHRDAIRAKSAVKKQADHVTAAKTLLTQITNPKGR